MMFTTQLSVTGMEGNNENASIALEKSNQQQPLTFKEGLKTILNDYENDRDNLKTSVKNL